MAKRTHNQFLTLFQSRKNCENKNLFYRSSKKSSRSSSICLTVFLSVAVGSRGTLTLWTPPPRTPAVSSSPPTATSPEMSHGKYVPSTFSFWQPSLLVIGPNIFTLQRFLLFDMVKSAELLNISIYYCCETASTWRSDHAYTVTGLFLLVFFSGVSRWQAWSRTERGRLITSCLGPGTTRWRVPK